MLAMMLDPHYKGLGFVIKYIGKEITLQIVDEYDHQVLFPFLVCAYYFLNLNDVSAGIPSCSTSHNTESTTLYDFMETSEEMASLIVKEQLNHLWVKKVIEEECKNSLAWWKLLEVQQPYVGFVAQQILGIVDSHIEMKSFFNIESIFTNLRCF